jgi:hypothetical protein
MFQKKVHEEKSLKKEQKFQKGQTVIYQGEEARILDVEPVLTIKIKSKNSIVCGDTLLNEVSL